MDTAGPDATTAPPSSDVPENTDPRVASGDAYPSMDVALPVGEVMEKENVSSVDEEPSSNSKRATIISPSRKSKRIQTRRKTRPSPKYFRDAITVEIPLSVTADLKIAIQRTRSKRIRSLYKAYPSLKKVVKKQLPPDDGSNADDPMDEDEASTKDPTEGKENNNKSKKKKKALAHVPQPEQYGSVLDYLEAKYVRGVMLADEEADGVSVGDGSEGAGSIYSGGSFLDDTDLQRGIAEQVMANTTLTKLELEDGDGEFFVNVGNLEVEENQYGENYDPAQDKDAVKVTKKRKKAQTVNEVSKAAIKTKKTGKDGEQDKMSQSSTSKKSTVSNGTQKKKVAEKVKKAVDDGKINGKIVVANDKKDKSDALFNEMAAAIKKMTKEELPRRKKNLTVSLTCPPNKNPGDTVTFTNPLNKEQRLRAKIPKNIAPGGTFRASVPLPKDQIEESADTDANKIPRAFQELADDYAKAYDDWCNQQSETDKSFSLFKEKRAKWDSVIKLFPKDLLTPVDVEYMTKISRRARQNRKKRQKTAEKTSALSVTGDSKKAEPDKQTVVEKVTEAENSGEKEETSVIPSIVKEAPEIDGSSTAA